MAIIPIESSNNDIDGKVKTNEVWKRSMAATAWR